ncbi:MAG: peptide ABC transporter substrate-binding protein [Gallionella sp.]|nr:peptide ABC transporter substrate-binding protein [Gallionella sp.]
MPRQIKESDWKLLSKLRTDALERFCQRILSEIENINANHALSAHQRYLEIYQVIHRRDKEVAQIFNDHRRSTAFFELAAIQSHGLLTPEEFQRFSQETRDAISWVDRV